MRQWEKLKEINGVSFYQPIVGIEETKKALKKAYDKFNERFSHKPQLFASAKQLKKDKQNIFL